MAMILILYDRNLIYVGKRGEINAGKRQGVIKMDGFSHQHDDRNNLDSHRCGSSRKCQFSIMELHRRIRSNHIIRPTTIHIHSWISRMVHWPPSLVDGMKNLEKR